MKASKIYSAVLLLSLLAPLKVNAEESQWTYLDYNGQKHSASLIIKRSLSAPINGKQFLRLSEFSDDIEIPSQDQTAFTNERIPSETRIRSRSEPNIILYGVLVSRGNESVEATRKSLNEMYARGSIKLSGDQLCPSNSQRVLILAVRDFAALPFCLTRD